MALSLATLLELRSPSSGNTEYPHSLKKRKAH